ncbi:MAG: VOC family protein [Thermoleophilia bacterium]
MSRLALVTVVVEDYDAAIAFFVDALGFTLAEDTPLGGGKRWVVVSPGPGSAGVLLARAATPGQAARVGDQTGGRVGFFLDVDDFAEAHGRMTAAGVRFVEGPREEAYGTVAVFEDLMGNRWDLVERRA